MDTIRRSVASAVLVAISAAIAPAARAQAPAATLDKAIAAWSKVRSLSGSFEQSLTNPLLRSTNVARGDFRQQRPNKLAIRFTDPAGDAIVADGKFLWVYLRQAAPNQVIKRAQTDDMEVPLDLSQFLDGTGSKYDLVSKGAEPVAGRPAKVIGLTPRKNTRSPFTTATIWVDDADGLIRQFEVVEPSGTTRRIRLTTVTMNPALTASDFAFSVPKGAKIVTP
jgi:outer membrane lipoprotein carrier protein